MKQKDLCQYYNPDDKIFELSDGAYNARCTKRFEYCPFKKMSTSFAVNTVIDTYCGGICILKDGMVDYDVPCVNDVLMKAVSLFSEQNEKLETLLSLPMEYVKKELSEQGLLDYIKLRQQLIHTLEMVEVLVYDTHEDAPRCIGCGVKAEVVTKRINGKDQEVINGEITHWLNNGKIIHDFTCDKCIKEN